MAASKSPTRDSHILPIRDYLRDCHRDSPPKSSSSYYGPRPINIRKEDQGIDLIPMDHQRRTTPTQPIGKIPIVNQLQVNVIL